MRTLIVEDDFASQVLLKKFMEPFGPVVVVDDGIRALEALETAWDQKTPFDLICLDIMLPKLSGQGVLKELRQREESRGIFGLAGVKVLMITALHDAGNILEAFRSQAEGYLPKPLRHENLLKELENLGLIPPRGQ